MKKFRKLTYLCSIVSGKLICPDRMTREVSDSPDCDDLRLTIDLEKTPKTFDQLKTFHGPIREQVQACSLEQDGEYKSLDKVKDELKNTFLKKEKQYYSDGSPVMLKLPHPERKNVFYEWHYEKVPSLEELSIEQMRGFIDDIINHFWHERGWKIEIYEKKTRNT